MGKRLWALVRKEFIQIRRDKRTLAMMIVVPVIWLTLFGYAATFDVKNIPTAVVNQGTSALATKLLDTLKTDKNFSLTTADSRADIEAGFERGSVSIGLVIPPDFGVLPKDGKEPAQVEILVDGSDFFSAQAGLRALSPTLQQVAAELAAEQARLAQEQVKAALTAQGDAIGKLMAQLQEQAKVIADLQTRLAAATGQRGATPLAPGAPPAQPAQAPPAGLPALGEAKLPVSVPKVDILYNPDLRSANMMIPGLAGMVILFITSMMTALGIVREKEHGTLEQVVVSPIRPVELMIGKLIPYTLIGLVDFTLVVASGIFIFDVPFAGNIAVFGALSSLFLLSTLGIGLLVSTLAENQQQAIQMSMFMVFPQFLVSGMIFPVTAMPVVIKYIAYLFPLTYFMPIARGMFLKGLGLDMLTWPAILLAIYGVAMVAFASARFRKRLG